VSFNKADNQTVSPISCPSCGSKDVGGLQIVFLWFEDNKFDFDSLIEESFNTRYFNSLLCNDCNAQIFEMPTSYFLDINKKCGQYEADDQIELVLKSLNKRGWNGENLYLIVNKGFIIFTDSGLEDISTLSKKILSENDFDTATYYTGQKIKQDKVYKIMGLSVDIILQQSE